jgi:hypothetical protein
MNRHAKIRNYSGRFEYLERRNPLAGNVTAAVVGGTLILEGDSSSNSIQVRQLSQTSWEVRGFDTRINGNSGTFTANGVLAGVDADLNRGDDFVKIFNGTIATDLAVETNQGADSIQLINLNVNGIADITTGDGNDSILVSDVEVNGTIESTSADAGAFELQTHGGSDVVNVDRLLATSAYLNLGSGNDSLAMTRSSFDSGLRIRASDGTDGVSLNDIDAQDDVWVHMGDGDSDALSVANSSGARGLFRGGNGDGDSLSRSDNNFGAESDHDFEFVS